jgi:hypothetical protein
MNATSNPSIDQQAYVARATNVAARILGGEMMLMSGKDSTLYTLNPTATLIWQAADGVTPLRQIVEERICAEFDAEPQAALRDAEELVDGLVNEGILVISNEPIPQPATPSLTASAKDAK